MKYKMELEKLSLVIVYRMVSFNLIQKKCKEDVQ